LASSNAAAVPVIVNSAAVSAIARLLPRFIMTILPAQRMHCLIAIERLPFD
jgi:hypothetical protein